jgi:hypothetical protein
MTDTTETFSVAEGARRLGITESGYYRKLGRREWPGRKVCNRWRLTEADIQRALDICYQPPRDDTAPPPPANGLSKRSTLLKNVS